MKILLNFEKMMSIKKMLDSLNLEDSKRTKVRKLNTHTQLSLGLSAPILNGHIDPEEDVGRGPMGIVNHVTYI